MFGRIDSESFKDIIDDGSVMYRTIMVVVLQEIWVSKDDSNIVLELTQKINANIG